MEVSNRVRNWNKVKNYKYVGLKLQLMPIVNTNMHIQINVSELINKPSFHVFWKCNRVGSWKEVKTTIMLSNSQREILVSYSWSTYVNVNMSFPKRIFEGTFSTYVFGNSFWHYRELKIDCWSSQHIYCGKKYSILSCVWRLEFL
jgi:hypothetical protein